MTNFDSPMIDAGLAALLSNRPGDYRALCEYGLVSQRRGAFQIARQSYEAAERIAPPSRELSHNLGVVCRRLGDVDAARACFERALAIDPHSLASLEELARVCQESGDIAGALQCYERLLSADPHHARSYAGMGMAFSDAGWEADAVRSFETALSIEPNNLEALNGLAVVLKRLGRYPEAISLFERALTQSPGEAGVLCNLAMSLGACGCMAEEEAIYRQILARDSQDVRAHFGLACVLLVTGRLAEGWREYEWRFVAGEEEGAVRPPPTRLPRWSGEPLVAESAGLVIYAEQGFGDNIQFSRFVPLAAEHFGRVRLLTRKPLLRLFQRTFGDIAVVLDDAPDETGFTYHCPVMSLPLALGTTLESLPNVVPYLNPDSALRAAWQGRLSAATGLRVGVAWATGKSGRHKRNFELTPEELSPLLKVPGVSWVSLTKEPPMPAMKDVLASHGVADWTDELSDFDDTAALIDVLDLVVSVDTAVAHLAGAIGKPVWLLKRAENDMFWLREREDSPWYPTMRLFRQQQSRQWAPVVAAVVQALVALAETKR
ncbi:tetratricopeptide repeat protein [Propionivibrio dicarboxylicus]|uniref:Tetratricopeptide (TPR) repeat n=1 Tax=Propionivibrio dicarboxylicus TaxID=83767 RepID=A0A1G8HAU1_9RHOO|nr:tetratricopeptide repeat protein [Propionivibrio dicarboxylicus]SDI03756.1 Tetratricopeptide (TPR) repeat [Propionivibrio dicarboxylicus]